MTSREKVMRVAKRCNTGANPFWTGHPSDGALEQYYAYLGIDNTEALFQFLDDDCRFLRAEGCYRGPGGRPMFDFPGGKKRESLSMPGCFAEATLDDVRSYPWPDPADFDYTELLREIRAHGDKAVFSGSLGTFFHDMCDFFGMEEYFIRMYTDPQVVHAATDRLVDFYVEANDRFFREAGDSFDIFLIVNDFGTQRDLFMSLEQFRTFILPGFKRLIEVGKKYGKTIMLHSCGSIYRVIPDLIDAGVDILHPIQAMAAHMDAETLAREFGRDLAFCGGVDTQDKLVNWSPAQIREEVLRLRDVFGGNLIVSASHEEILPNIPIENMIAMARAAKE